MLTFHQRHRARMATTWARALSSPRSRATVILARSLRHRTPTSLLLVGISCSFSMDLPHPTHSGFVSAVTRGNSVIGLTSRTSRFLVSDLSERCPVMIHSVCSRNFLLSHMSYRALVPHCRTTGVRVPRGSVFKYFLMDCNWLNITLSYIGTYVA